MENSTRSFRYEWEYYYVYDDTVIVFMHCIFFYIYSIVIIFWIILAAFVGFLFLGLSLMSRNANFPK
uniref:Melanocortin 2 receptor accessory protein n=1 Tax=Acanthochromis polyacanthus TaxID=80966 RepID=A0A3Q1GX66_9TELE